MVVGDVLARGAQRMLLETWHEHSTATALSYLFLSIFLVIFAGMMSGLTLGLMSMDIVELEVLRRSGSDVEQRQAALIIPIVKDAHFLLVTLLLCNAVAMEALPIFLDKIMSEVAAILVSVSAVLFMGEIFPQAICTKYGLLIGSTMAIPVRLLMLVTSPISFPIAKLLDFVLGGEHASLFRRKQLKALVTLHARDEGFGGRLTADEIQIITGALDLTRKTAYHAMTPLDKVFMLSADQKLDDATVSAVMASKPFSRLPVYRGHNKQDIIGVILVKELLEYVKHFPDSTVSSMKIRQLPRLSADTPMYDLLKLFRVGRSHMALLTQPDTEDSDTTTIPDTDGLDGMAWAYKRDHHLHHSPGAGMPRTMELPAMSRLATVHEVSNAAAANASSGDDGSPKATAGAAVGEKGAEGAVKGGGLGTHGEKHRLGNGTGLTGNGVLRESHLSESETALFGMGHQSSAMMPSLYPHSTSTPAGASTTARSTGTTPVKRGLLSSIMSNIGLGSTLNRLDEEQQPMLVNQGGSHKPSSPFQVLTDGNLDSAPSGGDAHHDPPSQLFSRLSHGSSTGGFPRHSSNGPRQPPGSTNGGMSGLDGDMSNGTGGTPAGMGVRGNSSHDLEGTALATMGSQTARSVTSLRNLFTRDKDREGFGGSMGDIAGNADVSGHRSGKSKRRKGGRKKRRASQTANPDLSHLDSMEQGQQGKQSSTSSSSSSSSSDATGSSRDDLEDMLPVPLIARPGEAIGIITIEDVIEELMGIEILDETDKFMDNEQSIPVNSKGLEDDLPDHLRSVLTVAERAKNQFLGPAIDRQSWLLQTAATVGGGVSSAQGSSALGGTSMLAGLAGSVFRHAFGSTVAGDTASGAGHAGAGGAAGSAREKHAGVSPVRGGSPVRGRNISPPKRATTEHSAPGAPGTLPASSGTGGIPGNIASPIMKWASMRAAAGGPPPVPLPKVTGNGDGTSVQRSDIRAATVMAAGGYGGPLKSMANWKLMESQGRGSGNRPSSSHGGARSLGTQGSASAGGVQGGGNASAAPGPAPAPSPDLL